MSVLEYGLYCFVSLFVIVEPITIAPVLLAMTPHDSAESRIHMVRIACLTAAGVLLVFALTGNVLLSLLGITLYAFQAAGGALLFLIALQMLQAKSETPERITPGETAAGRVKDDIAISPLAIPLLAGPGAISTSILLYQQAGNWHHKTALCTAIILVAFVSYWILRFASQSAKWLSPLVLRLVTRLMGLLLAALAVQFIFNGVRAAELFSSK
ncbi:MarC family protein [Pelagicoccus sp. SDUM812002]|uniref:MarC family protein n=1 Tax=Pelagicoccus sp. SDUM812002 TaxID=3041266 RepID=UPI0028102844|nr:MarC family protein [Pelagicoccus sp. SDUM812002]MDQ8184678.1 MarC family protein [Pelagicoccus sp. SDUM812002]